MKTTNKILGLPEDIPETVRTPAEARNWIANDYKERGYIVIPNPSENDLPSELWDFHMDFLAELDDEHTVIVVRRRNDLSENIKALADALDKHSNWILDLIVLPSSVFATVSNSATISTPNPLQSA
jgi:hypothetical protein